MSLNIVETQNEGLKRGYTLTIPAADIAARVDGEIKRLAPTIKMPGFRPGKVPANLIKKMHGPALHAEALNTTVGESVQQLIADKALRPAMQPTVELDEGYAEGGEAVVKVSLETLPDVPAPKIDGLKLERLTVPADESAVDAQLEQLMQGRKSFTDAPEGHVAALGDQLVIDFAGSVDGVAFDGGTGEDMAVELGSGQLIPGFEDQLVGAKAGEQRTIDVTFPTDYPAANLKGKAAQFAITVKGVKQAGESKLDDDFAKSLGLESLDQLKGLVRDSQNQELNGLTRTHMKRRLLDQLADAHDFDVPEVMVEAEYENIMAQLRHEAEQQDDKDAALAEIEAEAADYRKIAVRRVRLGLLLSEIGQANGIEVSQQEMNMLVGQAAQQYRPQDRERFVQYLQENPMAAAQLRAPLYEDKVVDFLFGKAEISDREVTRAELETDLEAEEGHVHGPNCGHDHGHADAEPVAKPAKKAKAAKADAPAEVTAVEAVAEAPAKKARKPKAEPAADATTAEAEAKPAKKPAAKKGKPAE